ncbi:MAG: DUF4399 domain-containing protein [Gammaproteobacteria bacterium]|nr:DUF4399 domain-containing protein [Gammaproteobacteria bacterium]
MGGTLALVGLAVTSVAQNLPVTPAPEGAKVAIISPKDGDVVEREFVVLFGLEGMGVAPAGIDIEGTGHHHLLVDQTELPPEGQPMGSPPIHFGKGQTQTTLTLDPGTHTLQLIMGDKLHIPHNPPVVSELITIKVKE